MPLPATAVSSLVAELLEEDETERARHEKVKNYLDGDHTDPYMYRGLRREYKKLCLSSVLNVCPTVVEVTSQRIYVDGLLSSDTELDATLWNAFQRNRMDSRQAVIHQSVIAYGIAFAVVLPGNPVPVITPKSALQMCAFFDGEEVEYALERAGRGKFRLYDAEAVYTLRQGEKSDEFTVLRVEEHGLGFVPVVVFRNSYDATGKVMGDVERIIPEQDSLNQTNLSIALAIELGAARQKYILGIELPKDPDGNPVDIELQANLSKIWTFEDAALKVGEFGQTDISGMLDNRAQVLKNIAVKSAIPANRLATGDLVNLSAEALQSLEASQNRKVTEKQSVLGDSWIELFMMMAAMMGEELDPLAHIRWRDTSTRSLSQVVDALGKLATLLGVPQRALWKMVPNVTETDIASWESMIDSGDSISELMEIIRADLPDVELPETA